MAEEIREVAVFFMDPDGIITVWNRAAEEMKGYTAEDAIGSHLSLLYTYEDRDKGWAQHNLREAEKHGFYKEERWRKRKDDSLFWARIALTALKDDSGRLVGFSKITMDLTDHKLLEQCQEEREQTRRVLRAANAGTWTWHPESDEMILSANFLDLLGYDAAEKTVTFAEWMEFVDPGDRTLVAEKFAAARASCPAAPFVTEMRMCEKAGGCHWFSVRADWHQENEAGRFALSGVHVDIQDSKKAGEDLQHAIEKLKEADARKDEFLAMLAHELRNPLAPVRAAAELLKLVRLDETRLQQTSEIIGRQVDHMTGLVDDLLDVSRVNRGLVELEKVPLDMRHVVTDAVEQVNPLIQARRHHLMLHSSPDAATVIGDNKRLVQVVANLLNNAAKYTHEGGSILLRMEVHDEKVILDVIDDGIGMEPELAARVFDLFAQAERTPDRSSGGLGLGLALVKSLVELHDGSVECSSEGIGKGSKFTVCLPLSEPHHSRTERQYETESLPTANQSFRIMVVDDNADAAQMLAMLLEASGHEVIVEHQARRALERSKTDSPDVCVLDIGLPEIDGNELAQRLRAHPKTADIILIAVTGYGHEQDRKKALAAGFNHYLVKPVDTARLIALLAAIRT